MKEVIVSRLGLGVGFMSPSRVQRDRSDLHRIEMHDIDVSRCTSARIIPLEMGLAKKSAHL